MKINDKIILYVDGQMNDVDKANFEKELEGSPELKEQLRKYLQFLEDMKSVNDSALEESYLVEMIPRLRGRAEEKKKLKYIPKLALGTAAVSILLIAFVLSFNGRQVVKSSLNNVTSSVTSSGDIQSYTYYSYQLDPNDFSKDEIANFDTTLNTMISQELSLSPQSLNYISADNNTDLKNMLQGLNEKEADDIYNQILHKKIF